MNVSEILPIILTSMLRLVIRCREEMLPSWRQTAAPHLCGSRAFKLPVILQSALHVPDSPVLSDCYAEQLKKTSQQITAPLLVHSDVCALSEYS